MVTRTVSDGLKSSNFKAINQSAMNLYLCGHVQEIQASQNKEALFLKAKCLPEMKKDRVYKLLMSMNTDKNYDIPTAECGCLGGKGPTATCKHIGALCYAVQNFCAKGSMPEFLTCTQRLQEWNKPRAKKVDPIAVEDIRGHQQVIMADTPRKLIRNPRIPSNFDPQPVDCRQTDPIALEKLRTDLLSLGKPCALLTILVPKVEIALHDHTTYNKKLECSTGKTSISPPDPVRFQTCPYTSDEMQFFSEKIITDLSISSEERTKLEQMTVQQSHCSLWYQARFKRITGSKCCKILTQISKTPALLRNVLYTKPFTIVPAPIKWGRDNEPIALQKYVEYMQENGHTELKLRQCGFFVHPHKPWLGASPDGIVVDPPYSTGLLEIKCPYSVRDTPPRLACQESSFYCYTSDDGIPRLKRTHEYYHQVQLELYVCSDSCGWCDFCVYTTKGILVERIYPDQEWEQKCIPQLKEYYFKHILPELVYPMHKPSYFL